ncbi:MAG: hypothetical protein LBL54_02160, partial [Clostridiales Family XIII bacterium]|nr:hypothetical protein [Clostridiales Family XIII bacterium]
MDEDKDTRNLSEASLMNHIESELRDMALEKVRFFAWLCGVRSLPFLAVHAGFLYWRKVDIETHLYSILYALDVAAAGAVSYVDGFAASDAGNAASDYAGYAAAHVADYAASAAARAASAAGSAASAAARAADYAA